MEPTRRNLPAAAGAATVASAAIIANRSGATLDRTALSIRGRRAQHGEPGRQSSSL